MKKVIKKNIVKLLPGLTQEIKRIKIIEDKVDTLSHKVDGVLQQDTRLDRLHKVLAKIEPYQPTYNVSGMIDVPLRGTKDRCRIIEQTIGELPGKYILDIGASLGYVCYYFAERGANTEGWEYNPENAEAARLIGEINGIPTTIKTTSLDKTAVKLIQQNNYDVITVLSVFHHIIYYKGLEYTQKLVRDLVSRTPLLIVELAKKGEDPSLFWDSAQPKDEKAIFELVKNDVVIERIAEVKNHLSKNSRPLYSITPKKKTVDVDQKKYIYNYKTTFAYKNSPLPYSQFRRRYYFTKDYIIKEYIAAKYDEGNNLKQIVSEIDKLQNLNNIHGMPKLISFEVHPSNMKLVVERKPGRLLLDVLESKERIQIEIVAKDILKTISDLEKEGLHHNDVRSWNVIYDEKSASLIDYGLVSQKQTDNDLFALLWLIQACISGEREVYTELNKLPPKSFFENSRFLKDLYDQVKSGKTASKILGSLKKSNS